MTQLDLFTREMLTNSEMLKVNQESTNNRQVFRDRDLIVWAADACCGGAGYAAASASDAGAPAGAACGSATSAGCTVKYVALFNAQSPEASDASASDTAASTGGTLIRVDLQAISIKGPAQVTDLWNHKDLGVFEKEFSGEIPFHGAGLYRISPAE